MLLTAKSWLTPFCCIIGTRPEDSNKALEVQTRCEHQDKTLASCDAVTPDLKPLCKCSSQPERKEQTKRVVKGNLQSIIYILKLCMGIE